MRRITMALSGVALAVVAAIPYVFSQQGQTTPAPRAALLQESTASVRIEFGRSDAQPRSWTGSVTARSGEVLTVRNWRPRPGDAINGNAWTLATRRGINFALRAWESERLTAPSPYINTPGVVIDASGGPAAELSVETASGSFTVKPFELRPGAPVSVLDGAAVLERVAPSEKLSRDDGNSDFPALLGLPQGRIVSAWVTFRNNRNYIESREFDGQGWSDVRSVAPKHSDVFLVKLARDRRDRPWAVWSAQIDGNFDLYGSFWNGSAWSEPQRLTEDPQPDIHHAVATDSNGNLWLVWQGFRNGKADIFARRYDGANWTAAERVSTSPANDWLPALAADSAGRVHVAWDTYDKGNYDVATRRWEGGVWSAVSPIAGTPKFEAYVSLACDKQNRLWAAWNEGGLDWGKDTGFLPRKQGSPLYKDRWVAVAVQDADGWKEPAAALEQALPPPLRHHNDIPALAADASGRVWLLFRHRQLRVQDTPFDAPAHRAAWEQYMMAYEGGAWTAPVALPFSGGRQNVSVATALAGASLYASWPTDNRDYEDFLFRRSEVYTARLPLPAASGAALKLQPRVAPELPLFPTHYNEAQDLAALRSYAIESSGKRYKIYRGDTHRHTEFSMDGNNDGSLADAYRYAIDAAELDFMLVSEHNGLGGPDNEYPNWLLQQAADIYSVTGTFVPFYGYERSVAYPNGHRNILFPRRGNPTLPIPPEETKGVTGAKMLYEYLKKYKGIAISHTSASSMGTDWRDNDPEVEPLVEIYQGDRVSAEYEGAPKAANAGNPASAPGGFRPLGYVWNAWAKGYKLGVQVASDHLSTHISYACTIATDFTRDGLIDAMRARQSYGATDNIVLDYRMRAGGREHLQGAIVKAAGQFELSIKVIGTQPVRQIDIVRNNQFVMTRNPMQKQVEFTFRDNTPPPGENYYYIRVIQVDDQMAWSSPIWIQR